MIKRSLILITLFLLCWQFIVNAIHLPMYLLPTPLQIMRSMVTHFPLLLQETWPTLYETLLGLVLGAATGVLCGMLVASYPLLRRWLLPIMVTSQAMPTFAIAPLIVLWLGYGLSSKIFTAILMIFFPVASACYDGLIHTPQSMLMLAAIENGTPLRTFFYVRLPEALPTIASGLRIAASIAPMGAVIGEWVGASKGLGYLMLAANARMEIDLLFAALTIVIIMALLLYFVIDTILKKTIWWTTS
jgi:putative hydroxymethylpyrimidine transport system permease protein